MNAHRFIDLFGIEKANRIVDNAVLGATFYSEKTGSYYSSNKNDAVDIINLSRAIREYRQLISAKETYETRLRHWNVTLNKALKKSVGGGV